MTTVDIDDGWGNLWAFRRRTPCTVTDTPCWVCRIDRETMVVCSEDDMRGRGWKPMFFFSPNLPPHYPYPADRFFETFEAVEHSRVSISGVTVHP